MDSNDGFITDIFAFLHKANPIQQYFMRMNIPDTIIYRNSIPRSWYFSDAEGQIKMKSKAKLEDSYLSEHFLKTKNDIIGLWITFNNENQMQFKYLNRTEFINFLNSSESRQGILQKFVYPKGKYNHTIRCMWSKQHCIFEKFQSKYDIYDTKLDFYQRILTYERDQSLAQSLVSTSIHERLENFCSSLVEHIRDLTQLKGNITKMILHFRQDEGERIWLLGCYSLKYTDPILKPNTKCRFDDMEIILPLNLDQNKLLFGTHKSVLKDGLCVKCDKNFHQNDLLKMKLKNIVESWRFNHLGQAKEVETEHTYKSTHKLTLLEKLKGYDKQQKKDEEILTRDVNPNYLIPDLIRKLFPKLSQQKYQEYLSNPGFIDMDCTVCYECHVEIDKGVNVNQDISKMAQQEKIRKSVYLGTEELKPLLLKKRFEITRKDILNKQKSPQTERRFHKRIASQNMNAKITKECSMATRITGLTPVQSVLRFYTPLKGTEFLTARQTTPSSRILQGKTVSQSRKNSDNLQI